MCELAPIMVGTEIKTFDFNCFFSVKRGHAQHVSASLYLGPGFHRWTTVALFGDPPVSSQTIQREDAGN